MTRSLKFTYVFPLAWISASSSETRTVSSAWVMAGSVDSIVHGRIDLRAFGQGLRLG